MRSWSVVGIVIVTSIVLLAGCSEEEASPSGDEDLFREYLRSTDVENDRFDDYGETPEDRLAQFAAIGDPQQVLNMLLSAFPCEDADEALDDESEPACYLNWQVREATQSFGADAQIYGRYILVKHADDALELLTVYVVEDADGATTLIDGNGDTYTEGLRDFRENNHVLQASDLILAPRDITSVNGGSEIVTVSGHTGSIRPWILPTILVVVVLGILLIVVLALDKRHQRTTEAP